MGLALKILAGLLMAGFFFAVPFYIGRARPKRVLAKPSPALRHRERDRIKRREALRQLKPDLRKRLKKAR